MRRPVAAAVLAAVTTLGCSDGPTGTTEEFCEVLGSNVEENTTVFQPGDPTDPDELVDALQRLTDAAPDEIDGDMQVLTDSVEDYRSALADFDPDDSSTSEALQPLDADEEERIREAQESVVTFAEEECQIDLDQPVTTLPAPPTTPTTIPPPTTTPPQTAPPTTTPPGTAPPTTVV